MKSVGEPQPMELSQRAVKGTTVMKKIDKKVLLGSVAVGALLLGAFAYYMQPTPKVSSHTTETEKRIIELQRAQSEAKGSQAPATVFAPPPEVTEAIDHRSMKAQVTGHLDGDGQFKGTMQITLPQEQTSWGGGRNSEIVKTQAQETWDFYYGIAQSVAWMGFLGLAFWGAMRYIQAKTASLALPAGQPGMMGAGGRPGTHLGVGAPKGAPAGADLSFMEIIQPEDNNVRLHHLILDSGLAEELSEIAAAIKETKRLYEEARATAQGELDEKNKKKSGNFWGDNDTSQVTVDMSQVKVRKPEAGMFGGEEGHAWIYTGDPGVGKTYSATALAGSAGVPIIIIAGSMDNGMLSGGSERVKLVMRIAENLGPCIIFVDEAEQSAGQRQTGGVRFGADTDSTTAAWLAALDGARQKVAKESEFMGPADMINVIMATNHLEMIDKAARRAGRMEPVNFTLPTVQLIQRMLKMFIAKKKIPLGDDIDHEFVAIATMLNGKSGADIAAIVNCFAKFCQREVKKLQKQMKRQGKSEDEIKAAVAAKKFGQQDFIYGMLDHLMGKRIVDIKDEFVRDYNTMAHELFHAICGAVSGKIGLYDDVMRLLCVDRRAKSLGVCMWSPREGSRTNVSVLDVLGMSILGYGGGAAQIVIRDDSEKFGLEYDLYRDSGTKGDNNMVAQLIKDSVAQDYGSLELGAVFKGQQGQTFASEMGQDMIAVIDRVILAKQRLAYSVAHKIVSLMITNPIIWEMIDEVLNSKDRIMIQERFYFYFEKLMADPKIADGIEALPTYIRDEEKKYRENKDYAWRPERQPRAVREVIIANEARLRQQWDAYQEKHAAEIESELKAEAEAQAAIDAAEAEARVEADAKAAA
jgi:SpoVK/Ycf46/Vps4 family AAA+-type ATPase